MSRLLYALLGIFLPMIAMGGVVQLSPLAPAPDWAILEPYQKTITRAAFEHLLQSVYSLDGAFLKYLDLSDDHAVVYSDLEHTNKVFTLQFATSEASELPLPKTYRTHLVSSDPIRPLAGLKIALDPGHIGGDWALLEERYFKVGDDPSVEEAELNTKTCEILAELLQADGAEIVWIKHAYKPTTNLRPDDLVEAAKQAQLQSHGSMSEKALKHTAAQLFYRTAEIRARAVIQHALKPDLTICVHYNADDWNDPNHPTLTQHSRLVIFVNGSYEHSEVRNDDVKCDLLRKLLDRDAAQEIRGCDLVGAEMLKNLGYPPESYVSYFAHRQGSVPSVYARNLIASRIYYGPVVYCEGPYMNAKDAYYRIIAGDYIGTRDIQGQKVHSIYRDYASAVEAGVRKYFGAN